MRRVSKTLVITIVRDSPWKGSKARKRAALLKAAEAAAKGHSWTDVLFRAPAGVSAYMTHMRDFMTAGDADKGGWDYFQQSLALYFAAATV